LTTKFIQFWIILKKFELIN